MNRTKIEWVKNPDGSQGYTCNIITGCLNHIEGLCRGGLFPCYAWKLAQGRLKQRYCANKNWDTRTPEGYEGYPNLDPFYPRFWKERLSDPYTYGRNFSDSGYKMHHHKGIFVCDMSDLFGIGIPNEWTEQVMVVIKSCSQHRFYLLTKQPQNLPRKFPENCWVGVTATNADMCIRAGYCLSRIEAKVKFLSLEPLLDWQHGKPGFIATMLQSWGINWLIIGACTGTKAEMAELVRKYPDLVLMPYGKIWTAQPKIELAQEIVEAADKAGIRVFLKDNLQPLLRPLMKVPNLSWFGNVFGLRQEMPEILYYSTCRVRRR